MHLCVPAEGHRSRDAGLQTRRCRSNALQFARPGFSFTEILFAVMILGIGFIMIAAIFPVAIQQTAMTGDETVAASIAREGTDAMTSLNNSALLPPTVSNPPTIGAVANQRVIGQVWGLHDDRMVNWTPFFPAAGTLQRDLTWNAISGNVILPLDHRYAWVAMYKRDGTWNNNANQVSPDPYAQVILIGVQCKNRSAYNPPTQLQVQNGSSTQVDDVSRSSNVSPPLSQPATLEPRSMIASILYNPQNPGPPLIEFSTNPGTPNPSPDQAVNGENGQGATNCLGTGAFVVVSDDEIAHNEPSFSQYAGQFNGHVFRLGTRRPDLDGGGYVTYELAPGYDAFPDPGISTALIGVNNAQVMVIGRGYSNPTNPNNGTSTLQFDGPIQDIAVYVTYIRVN